MVPSDLVTYNWDINTGNWSNGTISWGSTWKSCCGWGYCTCGTSTIVYNIPQKIYLYQVKCPAEDCGKTNWLELDKITECTKCGARLKAVSQKVDHEIQIEE